MPNDTRLAGPDFLDSMAEQALASGLEINAAEFRQRAREWRADQQRLEDLEVAVGRYAREKASATERERVLAELKDHLQAANDTLASATAAPAA